MGRHILRGELDRRTRSAGGDIDRVYTILESLRCRAVGSDSTTVADFTAMNSLELKIILCCAVNAVVPLPSFIHETAS